MQSGKPSGKPTDAKNGMESRWSEIIELWQSHQSLYFFAGFVLGIVTISFVSLVIRDVNVMLQNVAPEVIVGLGLGSFLNNRIESQRENSRRQREMKERLVREVGSAVPTTVLIAIREMRSKGWLSGENGLLQGADLRRANLNEASLNSANLSDAILTNANLASAKIMTANLSGTYLSEADLQGADLSNSNLQGAYLANANLMYARLMEVDLTNANLENANMIGVDLILSRLIRADLSAANLTKADLLRADFTNAQLDGANLSGADLTSAILEGADLSYAIFDTTTRLPDESMWTPDTDLTQFGAKITQRPPFQRELELPIFVDSDETKRLDVDSIEAVRRYFETASPVDETQEIEIPYFDLDDLIDDEDAWYEGDLELFDEFFQNGGEDEQQDTDDDALSTRELDTTTPETDKSDVGEADSPRMDDTVDSRTIDPYSGDVDETRTDMILRSDFAKAIFEDFEARKATKTDTEDDGDDEDNPADSDEEDEDAEESGQS
ncbi:MAG: pentapeptide repeat-containing protein [Aggregatilineales bacterium]